MDSNDQDDATWHRTCRICLDSYPDCSETHAKGGSIEDSKISLEDQFVSPCACTGTQAYVHLRCLRRWQLSVMSSRYSNSSYNPAFICSVCTQRFTIAPPKRMLMLRMAGFLDCYAREVTWLLIILCAGYMTLAYHFNMRPLLLQANDAIQSLANSRLESWRVADLAVGKFSHEIRPGTILRASQSMPRSASLFYRSVVLVYSHSQGRGTLGVVLNKPLKEEEVMREISDLPPKLISSVQNKHLQVLWGGPVAKHDWLLLKRCFVCRPSIRACFCPCPQIGQKLTSPYFHGKWTQEVVSGLCLGTDFALLEIEGIEETLVVSPEKDEEGEKGEGKDKREGFREEDKNFESVVATIDRVLKERNVPEVEEKEIGFSEDVFDEGGMEELDQKKEGYGKEVENTFMRHLFLGRAGWKEGQLASEINAGWWIVEKQTFSELLFAHLPDLWDTLSQETVDLNSG